MCKICDTLKERNGVIENAPLNYVCECGEPLASIRDMTDDGVFEGFHVLKVKEIECPMCHATTDRMMIRCQDSFTPTNLAESLFNKPVSGN